ncbi:unnamed protein product [Clonostachys rosea f. rosea IK726]|uniref:Uncharacterized protein n=1 Tax=Clonostachys rosea f. rosea IK726 TaxID=1349383 RepID=A0ACA9UNG0_BIOOC|nr:unnamed protein product [Clonostachys rosea f. rosea IK726]
MRESPTKYQTHVQLIVVVGFDYAAWLQFLSFDRRRYRDHGPTRSLVVVLLVGKFHRHSIYAAVMQREFQNTDNRVGKGFAILGIYLFVIAYYGMLNSTTWLYGVEVLPIALRSKVMGIAAASHFIVNVGITEAGPAAFSTIKENYYYVFVGCSTFFLVIAWFFFKETRQKTLEEIAEAFGDQIVFADERQIVEEAAAEAKLEEVWLENGVRGGPSK